VSGGEHGFDGSVRENTEENGRDKMKIVEIAVIE